MSMFARSKSLKIRKNSFNITPKPKTHLQEVNMTYIQHAKHASSIGLIMISQGCKCVIHSIFPEIFKQCASDAKKKLF